MPVPVTMAVRRAWHIGGNGMTGGATRAQHAGLRAQRSTGKLKLAAKPAHYDKLARSQELLAREVDPDTHMVSKAALSEELGSDAYHGGLVYPKSWPRSRWYAGVGSWIVPGRVQAWALCQPRTALVSRYSWKPSSPYSRPLPERL